MPRWLALGLVLFSLFIAHPADAQTRGYAFGTAGYGALGDDEGSLGRGATYGGGGGWMLNDRISFEAAITKSRHARTGSLSWEGDPLALTVRLMYRFAVPTASARFFVGGGGGFFRYPGTFTETIYDSPTAPPRTQSRDWLVSGRALEFGAGVQINLGPALFLRPETWVTIASVERVRPAPEPPYALPRIAVSGGVRF